MNETPETKNAIASKTHWEECRRRKVADHRTLAEIAASVVSKIGTDGAPADPKDEQAVKRRVFESRWLGAGLDPTHLERYEPSPDLNLPWGKVQNLLMESPRGFIVAVLGPRGCGKTQIAENLIGEMLMAVSGFDRRMFRNTPRYTMAAKIFRAVRVSMKRGRDDEGLDEIQAIESFTNPPLLVIDEAHNRGESDAENRALDEIVDDRYRMKRSTLFIGNMTQAEFTASMGPTITDRILERGQFIECQWPSFRGACR